MASFAERSRRTAAVIGIVVGLGSSAGCSPDLIYSVTEPGKLQGTPLNEPREIGEDYTATFQIGPSKNPIPLRRNPNGFAEVISEIPPDTTTFVTGQEVFGGIHPGPGGRIATTFGNRSLEGGTWVEVKQGFVSTENATKIQEDKTETLTTDELETLADSRYNGTVIIKIKDGLPRVRTDSTPLKPNVVAWKNIIEINGIQVVGLEEFSLVNPLAVSGENPTDNKENGENKWILVKANVIQKGQNGPEIVTTIVYVNAGPNTAKNVMKTNGSAMSDKDFIPVQKIPTLDK